MRTAWRLITWTGDVPYGHASKVNTVSDDALPVTIASTVAMNSRYPPSSPVGIAAPASVDQSMLPPSRAMNLSRLVAVKTGQAGRPDCPVFTAEVTRAVRQ